MKTLLWLFVAAILIGGWYYFTDRPAAVTPASPVATTTPAAATPAPAVKKAAPTAKKPASAAATTVGVGSISYLISLRQNLICTVKTLSGYTRAGTMYISGSKARGNFASSSMIDDGDHLYAWTTGAIKGLVLPASSSASGSAIATNGGIDLATDLSFACSPWTVDASVFTPPSSVSFFSSL